MIHHCPSKYFYTVHIIGWIFKVDGDYTRDEVSGGVAHVGETGLEFRGFLF